MLICCRSYAQFVVCYIAKSWISDREKSFSNLSATHTKLCNKDLLVQFCFKIDYSGLPAHRIWIADLNIEVSCLFLINVVYFLCWDLVISTIHNRLHSELKPCNFHWCECLWRYHIWIHKRETISMQPLWKAILRVTQIW